VVWEGSSRDNRLPPIPINAFYPAGTITATRLDFLRLPHLMQPSRYTASQQARQPIVPVRRANAASEAASDADVRAALSRG
jgi:hypothetical protein